MQVQANWENQLLALAGNIQHPHTRPFFSYWAGDAALQKAYKQAEKITAEHSKSFHFASGLLPEANFSWRSSSSDRVKSQQGVGTIELKPGSGMEPQSRQTEYGYSKPLGLSSGLRC